MKNFLLLGIVLSILIIETIQQATASAQDPLSQFNNALKRNLQEQQNEIEKEMSKKLRTQIVIWTSIALSFVLYFSVMSIINMSNPKSSILYAKYDTTRGGNEY